MVDHRDYPKELYSTYLELRVFVLFFVNLMDSGRSYWLLVSNKTIASSTKSTIYDGANSAVRVKP